MTKHGRLDDPMAIRQIKRLGLDKLFTGIMISNLGRVEIPSTYGDFHLAAFIGPIAYSDRIEQVLEVVTLDGTINLTLTFGETLIAAETVAQIRETAMQSLADAVNDSPSERYGDEPGARSNQLGKPVDA